MTPTNTYDIRDAEADHPLWFTRDAMRFFGTRLGKSYPGPGFCYLVTSEQPPYAPRSYNVRRFDKDNCDTVGPNISESWGTRARAQSVARTLAAAESDGWIRRRPTNKFLPCKACTGDHPAWAVFEVNHPTDPDLTGNYCDAHLPNVIGYAPLEATS